jgi:NADH pyrophosphatase NudC (nudix superfamily)
LLWSGVKFQDSIPSGYQTLGLRQLFGLIRDNLFALAGRANHLLFGIQPHNFVGVVGHTTQLKPMNEPKNALNVFNHLSSAGSSRYYFN